MARNTGFLLQSPEVLDGIGAARSVALAEAGIRTIAELLRAGPRRVHSLSRNSSKRQVGGWFCAAQLLRVPGVAPQLAKALVEGGIRTIASLADTRLETIEGITRDAADASRLIALPTVYELAAIQREASMLLDTGIAAGRLLDGAGEPLADILVDAGSQETRSDAAGRWSFERLPVRELRLRVTLPDRPSFTLGRWRIRAAKLLGPLTHRIPLFPDGPFVLRVVHELDGNIVVPAGASPPRLHDRALAEFRDGTHFEVRQTLRGGKVRLVSLWRVRVGQEIHIERTEVVLAALPPGVGERSVVLLESGRLIATDLDRAGVAGLKRERWRAANPPRSRHILRRRSHSPAVTPAGEAR